MENRNERCSLTRDDVTRELLNAKSNSKVTFEEIANKIGKNKVWLTSAILGQHSMTESEAQQLINCLSLETHPQTKQLLQLLQQNPIIRGSYFDNNWHLDPSITRLNEIVKVYGPAIKLLINEMTNNDGIMSAIDCCINMEKYTDANGSERIKLIIDGKFLEFKRG